MNPLLKLVNNLIKTLGFLLGIFGIFRLICNKKDLVPIILYHRVLNDLNTKTGISAFALRGLIVTKQGFLRQISYLKQHYKLISLNDYIERRQRNEKLSGCAIVTFDDGFRDFKQIALDILKANNCPATVFIISQIHNQIYWRHELYTILDQASKKNCQFILSKQSCLNLSLASIKAKQITLDLLLGVLKKITHSERTEILKRLREELGVKDNSIFDDLYLKNDDFECLINSQVEIGAHSASHEDLTQVSEDTCKKEINESVDFVRKIISRNSVCFSLPFGRIDSRVIEYLKQEGVSCAVTGEEAMNSASDDIFSLKRLYICQDNLAQFAYKVSGAEMFFHKFAAKFIKDKR
jgi:peptidoglycan/xylan/chitin deacetylase (PgdA/CDA1 family)